MLVTFIDEHWKRGAPSTEAAIVGASERLRPILMTACAMTVGHGADGAGVERGSQMQAPLGSGGDRRPGDVDIRDAAGAPVDLRGRDRQQSRPLAVDLPGRPRKLALRPARLRRGERRRGHIIRTASQTATPRTAATPPSSNPTHPRSHPAYLEIIDASPLDSITTFFELGNFRGGRSEAPPPYLEVPDVSRSLATFSNRSAGCRRLVVLVTCRSWLRRVAATRQRLTLRPSRSRLPFR